jgi:hypothetical protein
VQSNGYYGRMVVVASWDVPTRLPPLGGYVAEVIVRGTGWDPTAQENVNVSQRVAVPCCAVLCCAVLCCAVLCCAVLCCAVLCCAVLCCAVLCLCHVVTTTVVADGRGVWCLLLHTVCRCTLRW